jgi:hypothetical protein
MRTVAIAFMALSLTGCVRMRIHRTSKAEPTSQISEERSVTAVEGFVDVTPPVDLKNRCPSGWDTITTEDGFTQGLLRFVTLDLYVPWNVKITCLKPKPVVYQGPR